MSASIGLRYSLVRLGVADADAQQEAAGIDLVDPVERLGDGSRVRGPDVDDAGGHLQRGGLFEDGLHPVQLGRRRTADPNGTVTQRLDVLRLLWGYAASE